MLENGNTSLLKILFVNNVRTVSDTKKTFYTLHTRPINTIYRRVVEELMVEMHLLSVNVDFSYD
ncbi:MAG: photosystem II biogenesis protein Psp29, partial [Dolichospermum sp.]